MDTDQRDQAELEIWGNVLGGYDAALPRAVAEFLMDVKFTEQDVTRMHQLAEKARNGTLTVAESIEAEAYGRVGSILSILHSKARMALKKSESKRVKLG